MASITSKQRKQFKRFVEDGADRALEEINLDKDGLQNLIENGGAFQDDIMASIRKHSAPKSFKDLALSLNPTDLRKFWVQLWQKWDSKGIHNIVVPDPPTMEQIQAEKDRGRGFICLPSQLATVSALADLGKLFPKMQSWSVSGGDDAKKIKNTKDLSGWLAVELAVNMPNPNTTEAELRKIFSKQNTEGETLNTYIVFGQFCKEVFGKYPDIPGWVRLLGSSYDGDVLSTDFFEDGILFVNHRWVPDYHDSSIGGRSVAV